MPNLEVMNMMINNSPTVVAKPLAGVGSDPSRKVQQSTSFPLAIAGITWKKHLLSKKKKDWLMCPGGSCKFQRHDSNK